MKTNAKSIYRSSKKKIYIYKLLLHLVPVHIFLYEDASFDYARAQVHIEYFPQTVKYRENINAGENL